jgi:hypothetical protein
VTLVGELADPNAPSAAALAAAELANAQKGDRAGGTQGIYRAGGPTTLFGSAGWGPYSDGPLNAVRKSLLNRDGLNEENWMLVAAQRTAEAGAEWAKQRRGALVPYGGIFGATAASSTHAEKKDEVGEEERVKGKADAKRQAHGDEQDQGAQEAAGGRRRCDGCTGAQACAVGGKGAHGCVRAAHWYRALSVFFSTSSASLCSHLSCAHRSCGHTADMCALGRLERHNGKATSARGHQGWECAWALAWVDTVMELPANKEDHDVGRAAVGERRRLLELAAPDVNS